MLDEPLPVEPDNTNAGSIVAGTSNAKHRHIYEHILGHDRLRRVSGRHRVPQAEFGVRFDACRHTSRGRLRELERQGLLRPTPPRRGHLRQPPELRIERNLFGLITSR